MEPIDYQHENDTRALWFSEGVTSTVGDMLLVRAGLIDEKMYLQRSRAKSRNYNAVLRTVGNRRKSRAWTHGLRATSYYRSPERSISYYNKGEILGILLGPANPADHEWQEITARFAAVDERTLCESSIASFPTPQGVRAGGGGELAARVLPSFFRDYVSGVKEIPYDDFFQCVGLHVISKTVSAGSPVSARPRTSEVNQRSRRLIPTAMHSDSGSP